MELKRLTENVYYTTHEQRRDRPCLGYIKDSRYPLMVDAGNSPAHVEEYRALLAAEGLPRPKLLCVTHSHWDHTYGIEAADCFCLASQKTNQLLKTMAGWGWTEEEMKKRLETGEESLFCDTHIREEYPRPLEIRVRPADLTFQGEIALELDTPIRFFELVSPHAQDCAVLLAEGVLFLGDAYCSVPVGEDWVYDKKLLAAHIAALEEIPFSLCVKGHHPPQTKTELLAELRQELSLL